MNLQSSEFVNLYNDVFQFGVGRMLHQFVRFESCHWGIYCGRSIRVSLLMSLRTLLSEAPDSPLHLLLCV